MLEKNIHFSLGAPPGVSVFLVANRSSLSEEDKTSPKSQSPDASPGGPGRPRGWAVAAGAWPPDGPTCLPILSSISTADVQTREYSGDLSSYFLSPKCHALQISGFSGHPLPTAGSRAQEKGSQTLSWGHESPPALDSSLPASSTGHQTTRFLGLVCGPAAVFTLWAPGRSLLLH